MVGMATPVPVIERPPEHQAILWDGSAETAEWLTERFGSAASVEGDDESGRTLKFWGTWVIEEGWWVVAQWGQPQPVSPEDLHSRFARRPPDVDEGSGA